jgi:oxygen-independent coproporphyrinogen-3 oxidase
VGTDEVVSRDDHRDERVMTGLRYGWGLDLQALADELRLDTSCGLADRLGPLITEGLLEFVAGRLRLTPRGRTLADAVTRRLLAG